MSLVKRRVSEKKLRRVSEKKLRCAERNMQVEDHLVEACWYDFAIRRRLCNFLLVLFTLGIVFAGTIIVLHSVGVILLPTAVVTALIIVVFGATPRMLARVVNSVFKQ